MNSKLKCEALRFSGAKLKLPWTTLKISGGDATQFLHGQSTINIKKMNSGESKLGALVSLTGKLEAYFLLIKTQDQFLLITPPELEKAIFNRLQKYIVMEEVELEAMPGIFPTIVLGPAAKKYLTEFNFFPISLFGEMGALTLNEEDINLPIVSPEALNELCVLSGFPRLGYELELDMLFSETILSKLAYEPDKGCFLGQETVSKIENFRGPAYYPVLLIFNEVLSITNGQVFNCEERKGGILHTCFIHDGKTYCYTYLFRDFRIDQSDLKIEMNGKSHLAKIHYYPFIKSDDLSKAQELMALASMEYTKNNNNELAKEYLNLAITIKPDNADAYEALGVLLGHEGNFTAAIALMDQLEKIDPKSVMANTNKSLYLMKLGKIPEAEEEKNKATLKSFSYYGDEARTKQQMIDEKIKLEEENKRRESMFMQVLEIDAEDEMALFGIAEINFNRDQFEEAIKRLNLVLKVNPKYSVAYLLLGKCFEKTKERELSIETYQKGIKVAASKGDMMPANEMQARLSRLNIAKIHD